MEIEQRSDMVKSGDRGDGVAQQHRQERMDDDGDDGDGGDDGSSGKMVGVVDWDESDVEPSTIMAYGLRVVRMADDVSVGGDTTDPLAMQMRLKARLLEKRMEKLEMERECGCHEYGGEQWSGE